MTTSSTIVLENDYLELKINRDGTYAIKDKRADIVWRSARGYAPFKKIWKLSNTKAFLQTGLLQLNGERMPAQIFIELENDEVIVEAKVDNLEMPISTFTILPPLPPIDSKSYLLIPFYSNGIAIPVSERQFAGWHWTTYGALDMPWVGVTNGDFGYMLLWDGRSADDGLCITNLVHVNNEELLTPFAYHEPTMQKFGYPRRIRYMFVSEGGHVAICKRYRAYAKRHGFLVTLKEKAKRKPAIGLLAGAPDVWGANALNIVQFCREARAAGIKRMLINGVWQAEIIDFIKALGYLSGRYDNYEDLYVCCDKHRPPFNMGNIEDTAMKPDGTRYLGWETWDKKHVAYKRCSLLQLDVAKKYIPEQLKDHPHNTWFLDVTTATPLIECYDPRHPHSRTEDREAKRRLAKYVGEELGLVLGGEHGRWWGVDIYDYWEGMMSCNPAFTWPAGYLRPPQKREEIGEKYLKWGLGHKYRVPLWELVFHDCVVSYWYWGDSTDFLYRVAPELSDKKDVFNILYGTPPMFWVNKLGFTWTDPKLRKRLLQSYRITCKLHEQIAFDEMISHEYLTPDRDVQRTLFAPTDNPQEVTEVIVNFGEKPYALKRKGKEYVLPQFGFYVHGPRITQYRILVEGREVTYIKTNDYIFCDAGGKEYDFGVCITDGQVSIEVEGEHYIRIVIEDPKTRKVLLRPQMLAKDFDFERAKLRILNERGVPVVLVRTIQTKEDYIEIPLARGKKFILIW